MVGRGYETNLNSANTNSNDAVCAMLMTNPNNLQVFTSYCGPNQNNYQSGQKIQSVCQARYL